MFDFLAGKPRDLVGRRNKSVGSTIATSTMSSLLFEQKARGETPVAWASGQFAGFTAELKL